MRMKGNYLSLLLLQFHFFCAQFSLAQTPSSTIGYVCSANLSTYPCITYAFFRAKGPDFLDLGSISDLFSVSRLMISNPSNILSPSSPLVPDQPLFIPLSCSCNFINYTITTLSFANLTYTIKKGDTFFYVCTSLYQSLTTYQSVQVVNPSLIPTQLKIGVNVVFPIFCKCPNITHLQKRLNYLISYVYQPSDNLSSVASFFNTTIESIVDANGNNIEPLQTIFIPVLNLPKLKQPIVPPPSTKNQKGETILGLAIGLGFCGSFLVFIIGFWGYKKRFAREKEKELEMGKGKKGEQGKVNLIENVSDCLDKYRVYGVEELRQATDGFHQRWLIQGSVFKGCIDGGFVAIKRMKWNACEELKILQKVNHGNLVKLEGFCIDPEDANCYLVYEYVENGSLYSYLHENKNQELSWKSRLRIAIDVANGLQYIHEHTRPRVVHKDIKSANILLDANMRAKIANFGLAKSGCNAITMKIVGTQGYIAPEYISDGLVSTKMDVFSFGVILLELITGREAIDGQGTLLWVSASEFFEGEEVSKKKRLLSRMDSVLLEESFSMESVMNVMSVALACLNKDPLKRPTMVDIVYALCKSDDLFSDNSDMFSPRVVTAR